MWRAFFIGVHLMAGLFAWGFLLGPFIRATEDDFNDAAAGLAIIAVMMFLTSLPLVIAMLIQFLGKKQPRRGARTLLMIMAPFFAYLPLLGLLFVKPEPSLPKLG